MVGEEVWTGEEVWETEAPEVYKIYLRGEVVKEFDQAITAQDVKEIAKEHGIKKFIVKDGNGNILTPSDFPVSMDIYIEEYNEAA